MLYKRPDNPHWWVRFSIDGVEIRRSAGTRDRKRAEKFEELLRGQVWDQAKLNETPHTWDDAKVRWLSENASKRSLKRDREAFDVVDEFFTGQLLTDITGPRIGKLRQVITAGLDESGGVQAKRLRVKRRGTGKDVRKPATVLRILSVVRAVLKAAVGWGWLSTAPVVLMPKIERGEPRFITREEFERLYRELPPHVAAMARFSVETGQRYSAVAKLKWSAVDLERGHAHITSATSKSKRAIALPLSRTALAVLRAQQGAHPVYVFADHKSRAPIGSVKTAWLRAVKPENANLPGFRWHDLRHTWASWHTANGTPPIVLKELGGWSSLAMVERYSHLSPGHLAQWVESGARTKSGTASQRKSEKQLVSKGLSA